MKLIAWWKAFWNWLWNGSGHGIDELAGRLGVSVAELQSVTPAYREFLLPKRSGGERLVSAPLDPLKALQRRLLRRLLARLRCHPAVKGFQPGESIATNACCHVGQAVVVRLDLRDFFPATRADRIQRYFRKIGWNRPAARLLTRLCTHRGGLPQGAPTSPRLSNLVNYHLDCRLAGLAKRLGLVYTRYADDLTFSFPTDNPQLVRGVIRSVRRIVGQEGYAVHGHRKLHIRRQHQQQLVTGLVVNSRVNLPRETRRRLRAIEHHLATGRPATLTPEQLAGWRALQQMVEALAPGPEQGPAVPLDKD